MRILAFVFLFLVAASCGQPKCDASSCTAADGTCRSGTGADNCGTGGGLCVVCAVGESCLKEIGYRCGTAQPRCGPSNCAGCCDTTGACVHAPDNARNTTCGSSGVLCVDCTPNSKTCSSSFTCQ